MADRDRDIRMHGYAYAAGCITITIALVGMPVIFGLALAGHAVAAAVVGVVWLLDVAAIFILANER